MSGPSARELFVRVRDHLLAQGGRSIGPSFGSSGECAYRGADGRRCAVGCLISDEAYDPMIEGVGMGGLTPLATGSWTVRHGTGSSYHIQYAALAAALNASEVPADADTWDALMDLQKIHDVSPVDEWPALLEAMGRESGSLP